MEIGNCLKKFIRLPFRNVRTERIEILQLTVNVTILNRKHVLRLTRRKCINRLKWCGRRYINEQIFNWQWPCQAWYLISILILHLYKWDKQNALSFISVTKIDKKKIIWKWERQKIELNFKCFIAMTSVVMIWTWKHVQSTTKKHYPHSIEFASNQFHASNHTSIFHSIMPIIWIVEESYTKYSNSSSSKKNQQQQ